MVLESMKMELSITAPHAGIVTHLRLAPGTASRCASRSSTFGQGSG